jgi:hypothetical protein
MSRRADADERLRADFVRLMALPVNNPERQKLSDRVPTPVKKLDARARKFTTLQPESMWGSTARKLAEPEAPYAARLHALTAHLFTRQSPCNLAIPGPTVADDMDAYIRTFDNLNGLRRPA